MWLQTPGESWVRGVSWLCSAVVLNVSLCVGWCSYVSVIVSVVLSENDADNVVVSLTDPLCVMLSESDTLIVYDV